MTHVKFGRCLSSLACVGPGARPVIYQRMLGSVISMGCGGSRADAIEPRYHESWTRETESTWLTNTDAEIPNGVTYKSARGERNHPLKENAKLSGKSVDAKSLLSRGDRRMVNTGTQCGKQAGTSSIYTKHQRTSCSHEPTYDSKQTKHKEYNSHSEGVSSACHPEEASEKKPSSPDVEGSH